MHRFFVHPAQVERNQDGFVEAVSIEGEEAEHLARVLRLGPGETVVVCDGTGMEYKAVLVHTTPRRAQARVEAQRLSPAEPTLRLGLFQGLAKGDKMDLIVQKCTELGVSAIFPIATERSVVRLEGTRAEERRLRWERIGREAAKQSGRAVAPRVHAVVPLSVAVRAAAMPLLVPWEGAHEGLGEALPPLTGQRAGGDPGESGRCDVGLVIGPEGGLSDAEAAVLSSMGARLISLGPRILRTETAGLATLAVLMYAAGEFGRGRTGTEWR